MGFDYCSHGHMVEGVDEHLPLPTAAPHYESRWQDDVLVPLSMLLLLAVLVLGLVSAVRLLIDLASWLVDRF